MNPYHSGSVSPRRGASISSSFSGGGGSHILSGGGSGMSEKDFLPLPSSAKQRKRSRLPCGSLFTSSSGRVRRGPLALALFVVCIIVFTLVPGISTSSNAAATPALHVPVRADVQKEVHAVDEEDTFAEDDLHVQNALEPEPKTPEQIKAEAEEEEKYRAMIGKDKVRQLKAMVYWITRGGVFPDDWEAPSEQDMAEMGPEGFREVLARAHNTDAETMFDDAWEKDADTYYRVTVFSKSYCPHSRRAKDILEKYEIVPEPYIIELDERSDTAKMQGLLMYLTGRRTVPNVLVEFESIGGGEEVSLFHNEGVLGRKVVNPHLDALREAQGVVNFVDDE